MQGGTPLASLLLATISFYEPPVLNPRTYRSASGAFALEVDPGEPDGRGPGRYRLEHDGAVVWKGRRPFTFFEAAVADDGTVAGVSYSRGLSGGRYGEDQGELRLAVLDPTGAIRFEHVMPRRETRVIHGQPIPQSKGVLLDEVKRRVLLRLIPDDSHREKWWLYDLRTGNLLTRFDPQTLDSGYLLDVRRLSEGSRLLAQWNSEGVSRLFVLTPDWKPLWTHEIPGSIEAVTEEGFTVELDDRGELIDFTVTSREGRVLVSEAGRRTVAPPPDPLRATPAFDLPLLGTIELGADSGGRSRIRVAYDFDVDGQGALGFIRCDAGAFALVVVDETGRVLSDIPLELEDAEDGCPTAAWLGGNVWVVATRRAGGKAAMLHAVDRSSRTTRPFAEVEGEYLTSLRGNGGRGLLVLHGKILRALDWGGNELVRWHQDYDDESALFSPEDMTSMPTGDLAVLDNIRQVVQVFRADGSYVHTIDLESSLGRKASYPVSIAASPGGGFAIWDSGATRPFVLLAEGGGLLSEHIPHYDDGRPIGTLHSLRYAPNGALWASDGEALVRVNEEGIVDAVVGARPSRNQLTEIIATARDGAGRFFLADRRTGSVHVFGASGMFSHRCDPAPGDFDGPLRDVQLSISGNGTVYLSNDDQDHYVLFDSGGRRLGTLPTRIDTIKEDWFANPGGLDRWVTTMEDLYLTDAEGSILHRIRRHGDRTWLDYPASAAVASDGRVALLTAHKDDFGPGATLGIFDLDGTAVSTKNFPSLESFAPIAFDSGLIVLGMEGQLAFLDGEGEPLGRFAPDIGYDGRIRDHFLAADGRELQVLDRARRLVYRYDLSKLRLDR